MSPHNVGPSHRMSLGPADVPLAKQPNKTIRSSMASPKFLILALLFTPAFLLSQTGTSSIRGTVSDPQARVVSGATVTLTNVATNATRTTKSSESGDYTFELITPATYRLQVEAPGFKKNVVENVKALIGKPTEANITLEVGAAAEKVEVSATAQQALINTEDATLGNTFEAIQIQQLPLEAR